METHFHSILLILALTLAAVCILVGILSLRRKTPQSRSLALTDITAAFVMVTYLFSISTESYFFASLWSSLYFIGNDWVLICLIAFAESYINDIHLPFGKISFHVLHFLAAAETILFLINPFVEISISYIRQDTPFAVYAYDMHAPYYFHLSFTYFMVFYVLLQFLYKAVKTPRQYRARYSSVALILICIILINALFLYFPGNTLLSLVDMSVFFYCLGVILIYWTCFIYGDKAFSAVLGSLILQNIDQGVVFFDYNAHLIMKNERAEKLLPKEALTPGISIPEFLDATHMPQNPETDSDHISMQCSFLNDGNVRPVRSDYSRIRDDQGAELGHMFIFTDIELETDLLTGFENQEYFLKLVEEDPLFFPYPITFAVVDISNLTTLNSTFGTEFGDTKLLELSRLLKKHFPKTTYFVRGEGANLIAVCSCKTEKQIRTQLEEVTAEFDLRFHYGLFSLKKPSQSVLSGIQMATNSMKNRKLLDATSSHSDILNSLLRALEETDNDTEAHVRRTSRLGADLGVRIGLSDMDQSNLNLLCVLHDIGKIGIPLEILNKPGKLTDEEWSVLKTHTEKGYQIALSSPAFSGVAEMILYHHERWDGNGYPKGLSRESIPLLSRIIAVIDAYDAMINNRSYRKGMSYDKACRILRDCAGTQFDPYIVSEFLQLLEEHPEYQQTEIPVSFDIRDISTSSDVGHSAGAGTIRHVISHVDTEEIEEYEQMTLSDLDGIYTPRSESYPGSYRTNFAVHPMAYSKYILKENNEIIRADDNFCQLTGYTVEEALSLHLRQSDLVPPEDRTEYLVQVNEQLQNSDTVYIEHRLQKKDGTVIYVYCIGEVYFDSANNETRTQILVVDSMKTYAMQTLAEIEHQKAQVRMQHWEDTYRRDSLTGLLNRAAFQRDVEFQLLGKNAQVMMLLMDLDHFKEYNDTYGHQEGDQLLTLMSQSLVETLRDDDLACRMGGDEFAVALFFQSGTPREQILHRARQIFDRVNMTMSVIHENTSLSMGIVIRETTSSSFKSLYQDADTAMYESKNKGRNRMTLFEEN